MRLFRQKKDKVLWSDYIMLTVLILISAFLIYLIINTIKGVIDKDVSEYSENLINNYICIIGTVIIYFIMSILENKSKITYSETLRTGIILYFFLIVFVFNVFELYSKNYISIIANNLTGMLFAVIGVSIYYNYLKSSDSKVKAKAFMVILFSFSLSIAFGFVVELFQYLINLLTESSVITLKKVITDILYVGVGSFVLNIVFYISLIKNKKFINKSIIYIE